LAPVSLRAQAFRLLARREYARAELEQRLLAKGASGYDLRALLDELEGQGYLSNERYARAIASQKAGRYSRRSIAAELRAKGVKSDDIAAALAEVSPDDTVALAELWRRRFGVAPASEREKARQVRFLQTRGFAVAAILKLLREVGR
jgi:regulatory protein